MLISVITATLNSSGTIDRCLESVNSQRWKELEHIIVDGASSDDTVEKIRSSPGRVTRLLSEPDQGIYDALNKGIGMAQGEVIGFLHADDQFTDPGTLERIAGAFCTAGEASRPDGVYGDLLFMGGKRGTRVVRRWISAPFRRKAVGRGWMPPHPTLFLRREVYRKLGGFDASFTISGDYEFMLRVMCDPAVRLVYLPGVITLMRHGGKSTGGAGNLLTKAREDLRALSLHGFDAPLLVLAAKNLRKLPQLFWHGSP